MKNPKLIFRRIALLLLLSLVLGGIANLFLPNRIAWVEDWGHYIEAQAFRENISLADYTFVLRALKEQTHILLDARPEIDYSAGHIDGALSLPADNVQDNQDVLPFLTEEDSLVVYCDGNQCDESLVLALYLRENGFTNLVLYPGGWTEWKQNAEDQ